MRIALTKGTEHKVNCHTQENAHLISPLSPFAQGFGVQHHTSCDQERCSKNRKSSDSIFHLQSCDNSVIWSLELLAASFNTNMIDAKINIEGRAGVSPVFPIILKDVEDRRYCPVAFIARTQRAPRIWGYACPCRTDTKWVQMADTQRSAVAHSAWSVRAIIGVCALIAVVVLPPIIIIGDQPLVASSTVAVASATATFCTRRDAALVYA